ncbi:MAG: hypothetical protein ACQEP5_05655 [Actinomycetota bacterium]
MAEESLRELIEGYHEANKSPGGFKGQKELPKPGKGKEGIF